MILLMVGKKEHNARDVPNASLSSAACITQLYTVQCMHHTTIHKSSKWTQERAIFAITLLFKNADGARRTTREARMTEWNVM
jgi:hypothetical protein